MAGKLKVDISYETAPLTPSPRTAAVQDLFGIGAAPRKIIIAENLTIETRPGQIILITGPSGSGKSSILRAITAQLKTGDTIQISSASDSAESWNSVLYPHISEPLIDRVGAGLDEALRLLGICGLGEAFLYLRRSSELSDGQKYRFALAGALDASPKFLVADEFCSLLDRVSAKVVAYNLRKIASKTSTTFILATAHEDIAGDLQPEVLVRCSLGDAVKMELSTPSHKPISFFGDLAVEEGAREDWKVLAPFHYKSHNLGAVDKIFRLRLKDETAGVVVYAYPAPHHSIRNKHFRGRYSGRLTAPERRTLLNSELRLMQRLVIDPRLRGLGLASHLLRETLPLLSVPFVECLAVMAGFSRFLENAGFVCLGRTGLPRPTREMLGALRALRLSESEIHDPGALAQAFRHNPHLMPLLERWWKTRRPGVPFPPPQKRERALRALARAITSRPFYYLYDNRAGASTRPSLTAEARRNAEEEKRRNQL